MVLLLLLNLMDAIYTSSCARTTAVDDGQIITLAGRTAPGWPTHVISRERMCFDVDGPTLYTVRAAVHYPLHSKQSMGQPTPLLSQDTIYGSPCHECRARAAGSPSVTTVRRIL